LTVTVETNGFQTGRIFFLNTTFATRLTVAFHQIYRELPEKPHP
jgi:hypothetical protein